MSEEVRITASSLFDEVALQGISPYHLSMWDRTGQFEGLPESQEDDSGWQLEANLEALEQEDTVTVRLRTRVSANAVVITTDNAAVFSKPQGARLDLDAHKKLAREAVVAIFPFVREQVASLAARAGESINLDILTAEQLAQVEIGISDATIESDEGVSAEE